MTPETFWKLKLLHLFHDPPGKAFRIRGHTKDAERVLEQLLGAPLAKALAAVRGELGSGAQPKNRLTSRADQIAAGADRLALDEYLHSIQVSLQKSGAVATHPLSGPRIELGQYEDDPHHPLAPEPNDLLHLVAPLPDETEATLKQAFLRAWRGLPVKLQESDAWWLWGLMPADTRSPDHSIWDHLRMTSALSFVVHRKDKPEPDAQVPWLFTFGVGPVQAFIAQARKARDLWFSSFVLAELGLAAMIPVVERYGPDAIIYPDLRGNPRFDRWLAEPDRKGPFRDILPDHSKAAGSQAATVPNRFTAIIPRGGEGNLLKVEALAEACEEAVQDRWKRIAEAPLRYLARQGLRQITRDGESLDAVFRCRWSAVPWTYDKAGLKAILAGHGAPAQDRAALPPSSPEDVQAVEHRQHELGRWVPPELWRSLEARRATLAKIGSYLSLERGFDYPARHAHLRFKAQERAASQDEPALPPQAGEKCMGCGARTVLGHTSAGSLDDDRRASRRLWQRVHKDGERLCVVCAVKRFGSRGGRGDPELIRAWGGTPGEDTDVPFPSTALVAAYPFLEQLFEGHYADEALDRLLGTLTRLQPKLADDLRTQNPDSYPRLSAAAGPLAEVLNWETHLFYPDALESELRGLDLDGRDIKQLLGHSRELLGLSKGRSAKDVPSQPARRYALLKLDGDHLHRRISGDPEAIQTTYREILHPEAIAKTERSAHHQAADCSSLLGMTRLATPSLQAFISRALAAFAYEVVPWVIERELDGRVIYTGGDDTLALLPADQALDAVRRLDQLLSAPWVIDTFSPDETRIPTIKKADARRRFAVVNRQAEKVGIPCADLEPWGPQDAPAPSARGAVLPMLGRHQTLSAALIFAHFKTPLSMVLRQAEELLSEIKRAAPGWDDRAGTGLAVATRGGFKVVGAVPNARDGQRGQGLETVARVMKAFRQGDLPSRLPYKLASHESRLQAMVQDERIGTRAFQLLLEEETSAGPALKADARWLWERGWRWQRHHGHRRPTTSVECLLACRALAEDEGE